MPWNGGRPPGERFNHPSPMAIKSRPYTATNKPAGVSTVCLLRPSNLWKKENLQGTKSANQSPSFIGSLTPDERSLGFNSPRSLARNLFVDEHPLLPQKHEERNLKNCPSSALSSLCLCGWTFQPKFHREGGIQRAELFKESRVAGSETRKSN